MSAETLIHTESEVVSKRINFLGIPIDALTMEETLARVDEIIRSRRITQHVAINVAKLVYLQQNTRLREIVDSCGLINADGAGIILGAKLLSINIPERVTGIDLMQHLIQVAEQKGYRIFFFGAEDHVLREVIAIYKAKYPALQIAGFRNGYYPPEEERRIAESIRDSNADILFVAMGTPKKEQFLNTWLELMNVPFVMGVGGSFDVVAGKVERAPLWMQNLGLEWFYRLIQEPHRMWKRYLYTNSQFLFMLLRHVVLTKARYGNHV